MAGPDGKMHADHLVEAKGAFEPQRTANWLIEIHDLPGGDGDTDLIALSLETGFLPNFSNEEISLGYLNEYRYAAGKALFEAGELVVKDFVDRETAGALLRWSRQVYDPSTGQVGFAADYKKEAHILLFGPNGTKLRVWKLRGVWPQARNFGSLDMTSSEKVTITTTLRYDKALPVSGFGPGMLEVPES